MRCLIVVSVLVAVALTEPLEVTEKDLNQWELFKIAYQKEYDNEEYRMQVFLANLKKIQAHNAKYERGESTFKLAVNKFADLTDQEFRATYTNLRVSKRATGNEVFMDQKGVSVPKRRGWRKKGAVTRVKDQGQTCGSCWNFSATGGIEGQHFLKTKRLVSLSEQNLIDCAVSHGCNGSDMNTAFQYVINNKGIDLERAYPYKGEEGTCNYTAQSIGAVVSSIVGIQSGSEKVLLVAVGSIGPIPVAIDASSNFRFYSSALALLRYDGIQTWVGRLDGNDHTFVRQLLLSNLSNLNHGVLAVGYGHQRQGGDYWLVKNSWGTGWGLQGYILMSRNKNNQCGIATQASFPVV